MCYKHWSFCLIHLRCPKCRLEVLSDFTVPRSETCLSPPLAIDEMRPPPPQVLLQHPEELVGVQLEKDFGRFGYRTGGRSLRTKNPSFETSILANLELPALMAWPTSWKVWDRGS